MARAAILRITILVLCCALVHDSSKAYATVYCEDINGDRTMVGEARTSPSGTCYANVYWEDFDDELVLGTGGIIGGASTSATNLGFYVETNTSDYSITLCQSVTYDLVQKRSNSISGGCPSGYTSHTDTFVVDTCEFGDEDTYRVDKRFGRDSLSFNYFWQWDLSVIASGDNACTASDSGCAQVFDVREVELLNSERPA